MRGRRSCCGRPSRWPSWRFSTTGTCRGWPGPAATASWRGTSSFRPIGSCRSRRCWRARSGRRPTPTTRSTGCPSCCCSACGRRPTRSAWPGPLWRSSPSAARRRGITYTLHQRQNEATVTHLQAAEAAMKISCAELLTAEFVALIESRAESGEPYTPEERARIRAQSGYVARLCKEAVDLLGSAAGASSLHRDVPIQRAVRDLHALSLHAFVNPATNLEIYGRVLSGVDPGTPFL
ncbi:hypothetical protein WKI71_05065 [Streptomyces sp. MS1.AVA.1]|uniref:Acyl-CoA dehydrogenase C-terminal domain-containing protein n=1 Tax=Streptomyces machairae TaxID=3134109 RepID=A0ABU8UGY0_9ACTN